MARYQCRACGFDGQGTWHGALVCPRCGSRTAVATEERTDAELAAITPAVPGGEDLAEDG